MSKLQQTGLAAGLIGWLVLSLFGLSGQQAAVGDLGLVGSVRPIFFAGLSLLTGSLVLLAQVKNAPPGWTVAGVVAAFASAFMLVGLPLFVGGSQPVLWHKYEIYRWVDHVSSTGHLNPAFIDYHRYPLSFALASMVLQVIGFPKAGDDPYLLLELFPPVITLLWLLLLSLFLRTIVDGRDSSWIPLALWVFVLGVWDNFAAIGAQSIGYLGFLTVLALVARVYISPSRRRLDGPSYLALTIVVAAGALTHLLSALLALAVIAGILGYEYVTRRDARLLGPALLSAALVGGWLTTGASAWFDGLVPVFIEHALRLDAIFRVSVTDRIAMSGNDTTRLVATVRLYYSIAFVFLGASAAWMALRSRRHGASFSLIVLLSVLFPVFGIGTTYGGEILDRGYYAVLPALSYFAVYHTSRRGTSALLTAFLIMAGPTYVLARNGHLPADYLSSAYRSSLRFFLEHGAPHGSLAGNVNMWGYWLFKDTYLAVPHRSELITGYVPLPTFIKSPASYRGVLLEDLFPRDELTGVYFRNITPPLYVGISSHTRAIYERTLNKAQFLSSVEQAIAGDPMYGYFYSNGDTDLYVADPTDS